MLRKTSATLDAVRNNTPTPLTTVHLLICHPHQVPNSSTVLPLEFSRVRVTSTQVLTLHRSTVASDAMWTVVTLDDRCHQSRSSNVLWTIMTRWVLFSAVQCGESDGTRDQERNTQLSWICCILCRIQTGLTSFEVPCQSWPPPSSLSAQSVLPFSRPGTDSCPGQKVSTTWKYFL